MQAVVKTPHIEVNIKGMTPQRLISLLKEKYGEEVKVIEDNDDKRVNVFETPWYQNIKFYNLIFIIDFSWKS